ncbi:MAG: hypothetical protein FJ139_05140 [Deltaproteobacteria bacterium]|nr:hypothetical protein [Deltaproteobacteria bacterium]
MQVKHKDDKKPTAMKCVEEILLPNELMVEVWDKSRPIAADTTKVELYIRIKVTLKPSYFIKHEHFELVKRIFGNEILFEHSIERTFVNNREKEAVFQELLDTFKRDLVPYLSKTAFPGNFALSKYWDIEKNRYKYLSFLQDKPLLEDEENGGGREIF